jgi:hypothetical protein
MRKIITLLAAMTALVTASSVSAAIYSGVEVTNVNINNQGFEAVVAPGETFGINASYEFVFLRENCSIVQIIVGYDGIGAENCIANGIVLNGRYYDHHPLYFREVWNDITKKTVNFAMVAPKKPGVYEIRFRYAQAYLPQDALQYWWNIDSAPTEDATIGRIIVE